MSFVSPFLLIGAIFSALAALCAFLITYEEWSHHYASRKEPLKHAIEAAIVAFVVFMILTTLAAVFVNSFH
jgi:predicted membrane protein